MNDRRKRNGLITNVNNTIHIRPYTFMDIITHTNEQRITTRANIIIIKKKLHEIIIPITFSKFSFLCYHVNLISHSILLYKEKPATNRR